MNKRLVIVISAVAVAFGAAAFATEALKPGAKPAAAPTAATAPAPMGDERYDGPPKSRAEAIARTEKRLEKLKKMTDKEWEERQAKGKEIREKVSKMTPEQRKAFFDNMRKEQKPQ